MKTVIEPEDLKQIVEGVIVGLKPFLGNKDTHVDDIILDVPGLCKYLNVTPKWIRKKTHLKEIPYHKISNKQLRFRKRDIDNWLDSLKIPAISEYKGRLKAV